MRTLVVLRHGQSLWNQENRFTGWTDVPLTPLGEIEAHVAATLLRDHALVPDVVHTSVLSRCVRSVDIVLAALAAPSTPTHHSWHLNERHYGALQGLDKREAVATFGAEQVQEWRRSFDTPPPPLRRDDPRHPCHDPLYAALPDDALPASESLRDVVARVLPYWQDSIGADLTRGRTVLVVAHGNSLRALVMHLLAIPPAKISELNIPTGQPWRFDVDASGHVSENYYLDPDAAAAAARAVAEQIL